MPVHGHPRSGVSEARMTTPNDGLLNVIKQAIHRTSESITITDPRLPDNPLIYVNPAFYQVSGYTAEETIGRNCRFLQGPDTDQRAVATIRHRLEAREQCVVELLNYRKDGTPFWNRLSIVPIFDDNGLLTHFVGFQSDLTAKKEADKARAQLEALRGTMQTVNDLVRNFVSNMDYFRLQLQKRADSDPDMLQLYEQSVDDTLNKLTILNLVQVYREHEVMRGITGIGPARIAQVPAAERSSTEVDIHDQQ